MVRLWAAGGIVHWKISVLLCVASFVFMAMNADLLKPGNFLSERHHRGAGEHVLASVVGLSSCLECIAIRYEHPGHTPGLYCGRETSFTIVCCSQFCPIPTPSLTSAFRIVPALSGMVLFCLLVSHITWPPFCR